MGTRTEQSIGLFGVMTLAAAAGAVTALLFAPRKGSDTRQRIRSRIEEAKQHSKDRAASISAKANEVADKAKHVADTAKSGANDMVSDARNQVEDTSVDLKPRRRTPPPTTPL